MTLTTHIIVKDPVPVEPLFRFCQSLLGDPETMRVERFRPVAGDPYRPNAVIRNRPGQDLPAWLWVEYGVDGPLVDVDPEDEWPPGAVRVAFDTALGYNADNGASCRDLHAWLVGVVGDYLQMQGIEFFWQDEGSGAWFRSPNDVWTLGDPNLGELPHFEGIAKWQASRAG